MYEWSAQHEEESLRMSKTVSADVIRRSVRGIDKQIEIDVY